MHIIKMLKFYYIILSPLSGVEFDFCVSDSSDGGTSSLAWSSKGLGGSIRGSTRGSSGRGPRWSWSS